MAGKYTMEVVISTIDKISPLMKEWGYSDYVYEKFLMVFLARFSSISE
jgi:hypothetical protein